MNPSKKLKALLSKARVVPEEPGARSRMWVATGALLIASGATLGACEPELIVGTLEEPESCDPNATPNGMAGAAGISPEAVPVPWETSFEDGVCAYTQTQGYCYANDASNYRIVSSPVRSGSRAFAFELAAGSPSSENLQTRCVQQGTLPRAASYRAWFYLPSPINSADNWNLIHFDGREPGTPHGLWDVSISRESSGALRLFVLDFLRGMVRPLPDLPDLPIGEWFQVEVIFERASDRSGRFEVWLDGELGLNLTNIITDDTELGQWYVGNLAASISPLPYTLYVDDVAISPLP